MDNEDYRNERRDEAAHYERLLKEDVAWYAERERAREQREHALTCEDPECELCDVVRDAQANRAADEAHDAWKDSRNER